MEGVAIGHNFERAPSKDHSSKVWSKLAQWFLRRRLKCEKLTTDDGRRTKPDGKSSHGLWLGELKMQDCNVSVLSKKGTPSSEWWYFFYRQS